MLQVQTGLFCTGRKWCDFISYSNGMPMFIKRVLPDQKYQDAITEAAIKTEQSINEVIEKYREKSAKLIKTERVEFATTEITSTGE